MGSGRGPTASSGAALRSTPTPVVITVWETPGAIILLHADGLRAGGCGLERSAAQSIAASVVMTVRETLGAITSISDHHLYGRCHRRPGDPGWDHAFARGPICTLLD